VHHRSTSKYEAGDNYSATLKILLFASVLRRANVAKPLRVSALLTSQRTGARMKRRLDTLQSIKNLLDAMKPRPSFAYLRPMKPWRTRALKPQMIVRASCLRIEDNSVIRARCFSAYEPGLYSNMFCGCGIGFGIRPKATTEAQSRVTEALLFLIELTYLQITLNVVVPPR